MTRVEIEKKYLMLSVDENAELRKLLFYQNGNLIFDLDVRLAAEGTCGTTYYVEIERFGSEVDIDVEPALEWEARQSDSDDSETLYREARRPLVHFTAKRGWINDPNGLTEYTSPVTGERVYHLFFQHNPCSVKWGNMHWGHAVSGDLLHWKQVDCALYPDALGTMYSGSGIVDKENLSGLKDGAEDVLLCFYTAAGGENRMSQLAGAKYTQCLAYSTDGGATFRKYGKNPIVPHISGANRDPKVIWCAPLGCYVMALYLEGDRYALLTSINLTEWTPLQELQLEGDDECPDFYPLVCADDGAEKWIFSGASHHYVVGDFADGKYVPSQRMKKLHYGTNSYASQTISNVSDGRRINIAWDTVTIPDCVCNCHMGIPMEHTLRRKENEYYLCAQPVRELETLRGEKRMDFHFTGHIGGELPESAELSLESDIRIGAEGEIRFTVYGAEFVCDLKNNRLTSFGRYEAPLALVGDEFRLRLVCDRNSIEIYAGDGEVYHVYTHVAENNRFAASADVPTHVKAYGLTSIW